MTDPILPPGERERTRDTGRRESQRLRAFLDTERQIRGDAALADRAAPADTDALERIAAQRRHQKVISEAQREGDAGRLRGVGVARRAINATFFVVYALLAMRLVFALLRADPAARFVEWVTRTSEPLHAPFRGLFPNVLYEDGFTFALSVAFAMLVYALLHALIHAILRVLARLRPAV